MYIKAIEGQTSVHLVRSNIKAKYFIYFQHWNTFSNKPCCVRHFEIAQIRLQRETIQLASEWYEGPAILSLTGEPIRIIRMASNFYLWMETEKDSACAKAVRKKTVQSKNLNRLMLNNKGQLFFS